VSPKGTPSECECIKIPDHTRATAADYVIQLCKNKQQPDFDLRVQGGIWLPRERTKHVFCFSVVQEELKQRPRFWFQLLKTSAWSHMRRHQHPSCNRIPLKVNGLIAASTRKALHPHGRTQVDTSRSPSRLEPDRSPSDLENRLRVSITRSVNVHTVAHMSTQVYTSGSQCLKDNRQGEEGSDQEDDPVIHYHFHITDPDHNQQEQWNYVSYPLR
jgi:hypothetical protein